MLLVYTSVYQLKPVYTLALASLRVHAGFSRFRGNTD
jgi:hypothetical protein